MKVKLYRSASVGVDFKDIKILQDPWLTDGEYYGSWFHYPPFNLKKNLRELREYEYVYVSHIHPDHCSLDTIKFLNKKTKFIILSYHSKFLKKKIQNFGFDVIELDHGQTYSLGNKKKITIYAADACDPQLCYKFLGCANFKTKKSNHIDSLAVIENKNYKILNLNDCPYQLAKKTLNLVKKKHKNISLLLLGYGGAGPYPQCFDNLNTREKKIESEKKKIKFLEDAKKYIDFIKPQFYLPFAGTYTLGGKLGKYQNLRGVPTIEEAFKFLENNIEKKISKPLKLNIDSFYDFDKKIFSKKFIQFKKNEEIKYIKNNLSKKKFTYNKVKMPSKKDLKKLVHLAFDNYLKKTQLLNFSVQRDIVVKSRKIIFKISPKNRKIIFLSNFDKKKNNNYLMHTIDTKLLYCLLKGPKHAHWNNAEIGSHIKFYRKPDVFDRDLHASMCYFHC